MQESAAIHDKLLAIYIRLLCQSPDDSKTKQKLRHFLLFSQNYDRQKAQQLFAQQNGHFSVESLLTKAKVCKNNFLFWKSPESISVRTHNRLWILCGN
jgi:hypothetical protein